MDRTITLPSDPEKATGLEGRVNRQSFNIPRSVTVQSLGEKHTHSPTREHALKRQNSVSFVNGPQRGDTASRLVGEFRTLSIHVTESQQRSQEALAKKERHIKEVADLEWHLLTHDEALQRLNVSQKVGLDPEVAQRRLKQNGPNAVTPHKPNVLLKWVSYVFGGFGTILFIASILCFIAWKPLGEPAPAVSNLALAIVIIVVIVIQTIFNAWQDFSTGRVMASISGMLPSDVQVLRDGRQSTIPARDLVVGDLVYLSLGDKLPADLRFVEVSSDLRIDRAVLTGESEPIQGTIEHTDPNFLETKNIGLQGTLCVGGSALGAVIQTGDQTVFGRIARLSTAGAPRLTTLQREILRFVLIIVSFALTIAIIVIILWAAWLRRDHPGFISNSALVVNVVAVCVAFIPEGLPASVTISLAVIANTLSKAKVLCKSLMTVETLGAVNVLCSDKTGTLTMNQMTVTNVAVLDDELDVTTARDRVITQHEAATNISDLAAVAGICNAASFDESTMDQPIGLRLIHGDATDSALLRFSESIRPVSESNAEWEAVFTQNFNSKTKYMTKLLQLAPSTSNWKPAPISQHEKFSTDTTHRDLMLMCKGAPDVLLKRCAYVNDPNGGKPIALSQSIVSRLTRVQESWATKGRRVLLLTKRTIPFHQMADAPPYDHPDFPDYVNIYLNTGLTIVGLAGLVEPPRADIPNTVRILRTAGIRFMMVTGDFALTAVAIAEQCGIVTNAAGIHHLSDLKREIDLAGIDKYDPDTTEFSKSLVLSGPDLMEMNDSQWEQACQYPEIVFARTTPEQKLRIVKEFQKRECVVAMTGDGVNDAPSLKAADVGIAMGGGSDVAMEAADLVLLESFSSIVIAVQYGRTVFDNLKKTCLYLLPAGSFSELMPILLNVLFGLPQILSNIQMILICVVTDVLPAIALCFEKPEEGVMTRKPRNVKKDRLVDWKLLFHAYAFLGIIESLCAISMAFWYLDRRGFKFTDIVMSYGVLPESYDTDAYLEAVNVAQSVYFFTLVGMQWGNLLATRTRRLSIFQHNPFSLRGPSRNGWILPAMLTSVAFLFFFSYVPFFQNTFLTRGVPVEHIFIPFTFAVGILLLDEARKYVVRAYPNGFLASIAW